MLRSRRSWVAVALVLVLVLVTGACTSGGSDDESAAADDGSVFAGRPMPEPTPKPEFTLPDTTGEPYDFAAETEGKVTYLYFGYTFCPDVCPVHLAQLSEVLDQPGVPDNVEVVFVTVDPERDTPEVVRSFLDEFSTEFVGLVGTADEVEAAQRATGLTPAIKEPDPDDPESYTMGHEARVIGYAPNGLGYVNYPFGSRQSEFAHDLEILAGLREVGDEPTA